MNQRGKALFGLLAFVYAAVALAGFVAPSDPTAHNREFPFAPPTRIRFVDASGALHLRPFVYRLVASPGSLESYEEDTERPYPIRFFVRGTPYSLAGMVTSNLHLFGTESPTPLFLSGSDQFGRDLFSRLLHGGQISLFAGLLGAAVTLTVGLVLGALAGFYPGRVDDAIMRGAELFLALPWLYLLLAVRMSLPMDLDPSHAFLLIVAIVGLVGWARPARLIRGVVLAVREREHVVAARSAGASDVYLLRRHVLPQVTGLALTQASLLIPQFVLAEVTLSFFGLGVMEPTPSWGNMLASLQRYHVLASYWWMLFPGIALVGVFLLYYALADAVHRQLAIVPR